MQIDGIGIMLTHGPLLSILDTTAHDKGMSCAYLRRAVEQRWLRVHSSKGSVLHQRADWAIGKMKGLQQHVTLKCVIFGRSSRYRSKEALRTTGEEVFGRKVEAEGATLYAEASHDREALAGGCTVDCRYGSSILRQTAQMTMFSTPQRIFPFQK